MFYQGPTVGAKMFLYRKWGYNSLKVRASVNNLSSTFPRLLLLVGMGGGYLTHVVGSRGFSRPFVWRLYELGLVCAIEMG
jgi:hypothetical protein